MDSLDVLGFPQTQKVPSRSPLLSSLAEAEHSIHTLSLGTALSFTILNPLVKMRSVKLEGLKSCFLHPNWATYCGRWTHAHQHLELFYFRVHTGFHFSVPLKLGIATWLVIAMKSKREGCGSLSISFLVLYPPTRFLWALVYWRRSNRIIRSSWWEAEVYLPPSIDSLNCHLHVVLLLLSRRNTYFPPQHSCQNNPADGVHEFSFENVLNWLQWTVHSLTQLTNANEIAWAEETCVKLQGCFRLFLTWNDMHINQRKELGHRICFPWLHRDTMNSVT